MTWSTWKTPPAKHQAGEEWCLQCGTDGKPERAIGVDEDGEPACGLHRVKEIGAGLNAAGDKGPVPFPRTPVPAPVVFKQAAERPAPDPRYGVTKAVSSAADQQPTAAPSPVQTSAKEKVMGGKEKQCPCGCGTMFTATGNRQVYAPGHKPAEKKSKSKTPKTPKAKTLGDLLKPGALVDATKGPALAPLQLEDIAPLMPGMNERVIHFYLGESKVQKLLNLLLAD
jgi:hypothetical protein